MYPGQGEISPVFLLPTEEQTAYARRVAGARIAAVLKAAAVIPGVLDLRTATRREMVELDMAYGTELPNAGTVMQVLRSRVDLRRFCAAHGIYEVLTREYVDGLADYLAARAGDTPTTVLEVGTGNRRLSHFLRQSLHARHTPPVNVIAIDSFDWSIHPFHPVEHMGHREALAAYQPDIVLCSWMPQDTDFTADFRAVSSVQEYILIGNPGNTGTYWGTHGVHTTESREGMLADVEAKELSLDYLPPYSTDGFMKYNHPYLTSLQICQDDMPPNVYFSQTNSFIRQ